jgi:hypothetical protein
MKDGIVAGIILVLGLLDAAIGLPLLFLYLILTGKKLSLNKNNGLIVSLLLIKVLWISLLFIYFKKGSFFCFFQTIGMDLMILLTFFLRKDEDFYRGLFSPIAVLFAVDFIFNIWSHLFGMDPLGRIAITRPDDIIPRVGGIFFHPFYSINISFIMILFSIYMRHRLLLLLAVANIATNGSYRGILTLIVLVVIYFLLTQGVKFKKLVTLSVAMVAIIFVIAIFSINYLGDNSGNYYRLFAWRNAIENIMINPIMGTHKFSIGELPNISKETIMDFGIAESTYLSYAMHYGILPAIIHFLVILFIFSQRVRLFYSRRVNSYSNFHLVAAVFSGVVFVDSFYGTVLGSMLTTMCYGLICISNREVNNETQLGIYASDF